MPKRQHELIDLTIRDEWPRCEVPVHCRLKRFLKMALRSYGLRCTSIGGRPPELEPEPAKSTSDGSGGSGGR